MKKALFTLALVSALSGLNAQTGNVGIGTTSPEASAKLDIVANNKGVRIPQVSLQSYSDVTTISSPATSLLVYNTNASLTTPQGSGTGYYYNSGTSSMPQWVRLSTGSLTTAKTMGNVDPSRTVSIGEIEVRYSSTGTNGFVQVRSTTGSNLGALIFYVENWVSGGYGVGSSSPTITSSFANIGSSVGTFNEMNTFYINIPSSGTMYRVTYNLFDANNEMILVEKF